MHTARRNTGDARAFQQSKHRNKLKFRVYVLGLVCIESFVRSQEKRVLEGRFLQKRTPLVAVAL